MSKEEGDPATPAEIIVELEGKRVVAEPGKSLRIGRDADCDLIASGTAGSREHARITFENGQWVLIDTSSNGTYVNGRRVDRLPLTGTVEARLGHPATGDLLRISSRVPAATRIDAGATAGAATVLGPGPNTGPGQAAAGSPGSLRVQSAGRSYDFAPGKVVTIGRDDNCDVKTDNPVVSRVHARVVHGSSGWVLEDAGSSRGIFFDGRQVSNLELRDTTTVTLGPERDGLRVVFLPARESARGRGGRTVAIAASTIAVIAAVVVAVVLIANNGGGSGGASLADLKRATVRLTATVQTPDGPQAWSGSGTVISRTGLILTNAHVAQPLAPGQGVRIQSPLVSTVNPDYLTVDVASTPDQPATAAYRARVVDADGYLDLAVLKIYADAHGNPVSPSSLKLEAAKLGDSDKVKGGDALQIIGFPGIAQSNVADVRNGEIGALVTDPQQRVAGRFQFNTNTQIAHGDSGGLAADTAFRVIGVPSELVPPMGYLDPSGNRLIPINLAKPLIADVESGRAYDPYTYVTRVTGAERAEPAGFAVGNQACAQGSIPSSATPAAAAQANRYTTTTPQIDADFRLQGMTPNQELLAALVSPHSDEQTLVASTRWTGSAIDCARFQIPTPPGGLEGGAYRVFLFVGPNYENVLAVAYVGVG